MAKILIKFNGAFIKEVALVKDETTFGRKPTNDISIDHATISGSHGKIKKEGNIYTIEDLNSTNGTFINGRRIKTGQLKDKDQIGVAGHIFDFHLEEATAPATPAAPPQQKAPVLNTPTPVTPAKGPEVQDPEKIRELFRKNLGLGKDGKPLPPDPPKEKETDGAPVCGIIRIIAGGVNGQIEIILKDLVTYIGTTDQALIKIAGFLAPSLAAAISQRPDGFFLKAIKPDYPKVNGLSINEQVLLENGALIEVGGTNMVFYRSDAKKETAKEGQS